MSVSASAQTIGSLADRRLCSTMGGEPLARQLAAYQRECLTPGKFVRFHPHGNIELNYPTQIHPYLQPSARDAIWSVADAGSVIRVSSAFRPISDQYMLWKSLGGPSACIDAATPGSSRHQSGRAVDLSNAGALASVMNAAGCIRLVGDPPHFDCPGENLGPDSIRSFQTLWNRNNPGDLIDEDGAWGPQTESRLRQAPAAGFASADCGPMQCEPVCENGDVINADCSRTDCGVLRSCSEASGSAVCASVFCLDEQNRPISGKVCTPNNTALVTCNADGTAAETVQCDCLSEDEARCDGQIPDAGITDMMDASPLPADADIPWLDANSGDANMVDDPTASCGCRIENSRSSASAWFSFLLGSIVLRRIRRKS